jgi:integrase
MIRVLVRKQNDRDTLTLYYVDPLTRKTVSRSAGTSDRLEAERAAQRWQQELDEFRGPEHNGWAYFRERFSEEHLGAVSQATRNSYGTALNHYKRLMDPRTVADVTAGTVSMFQAKLLAEKRPLTSIANYLRHLKYALKWAAEVGLIAKAPLVKLPKIPKRRFSRGRPITLPEVKRLLRHCPDAHWRRFLRLLWLSGFRLGEALRLSWNGPPIQAMLDAQPYPAVIIYGEAQKSGSDEAWTMPPDLAAWLRRTPVAKRTGKVAPLPIRQRRLVSRRISAIGKAAGIVVSEKGKAASAHDIRRGFGQRWAPRVMPATLQRLMRHRDISTTLGYYVHLTASDVGRELWQHQKPQGTG